jgi:cell division protein FtsI/penicillin-binding protein 2
LIVLALAAFIAGIIVSGGPGRAEKATVKRYVLDWSHGRYDDMYTLLDSESKQRYSQAAFVAALRGAADTATWESMRVVSVGSRSGDFITVQMRIATRIFGLLRETLEVPLTGSGSSARVHFSSAVAFPGLRTGETLTRHLRLPPRAALLARDGTPLAEGSGRTSPIPDVAGEVVGTLGAIPAAQASTYAELGYPTGTQVGQDGLERVFETSLAGTPGGTLSAGSRVLARVAPIPGRAIRTSIDPRLERAAISAMAGQYAGIAAIDPKTGEVLALAGVAYSALQPPGSTMKIVTVSAALSAGIVHLGTTFADASSANLEGFNLQNANGEVCGGTLLESFATSCNSVFAPLGAKLGGPKLVAMAEKFGFNQTPSIPGAAEPTIPSASKIGDDLAVGSSAIGQGMVQSSALGMTDVAATIAGHGRRPLPTLFHGGSPRFVPVLSRHIAGLVQRLMIAVVNDSDGTGTSAQIPGVVVAGKTGTAELTDTTDPNNPNAGSPSNTDAWFVGYAPAGHPKLVVGALFPNAGAGGSTAAPAVRQVLQAGLSEH